MKLLSKEEEKAHYNAAVKGGLLGGVAGLGLGVISIVGASRRYPIVRHLTVPMKVFLVTSAGTFAAIINADWASRDFEKSRQDGQQYVDLVQRQKGRIKSQQPFIERSKDWARENRYAVIGGSWAASMGIALGIVGRNRYQTAAQKLVQARVYAQGLTVLVLLATAALEIGDQNQGKGRWETVRIVDPNDPEHKRKIEKKIYHEDYVGESQWKDMVAAEERRMKDKQRISHKQEGHRRAVTRTGTKEGGESNNEGKAHGTGLISGREPATNGSSGT